MYYADIISATTPGDPDFGDNVIRELELNQVLDDDDGTKIISFTMPIGDVEVDGFFRARKRTFPIYLDYNESYGSASVVYTIGTIHIALVCNR